MNKKAIFAYLLCALLILSGCAREAPSQPSETTPPLQLANPWKEYASLAEAEAAAGFPLSLPETVEGSYTAETFRVMDGALLEVTYRDETFKVTVRKMAGEGQDLSGDYRDYDSVHTEQKEDRTIINKWLGDSLLTLISYDGYSYSLYAPNGYWGDSHSGFLSCILGSD